MTAAADPKIQLETRPLPDVVRLEAAIRNGQRLAALAATRTFDVPPIESLERLTRLAARLLRVPTCTVSLVDVDRQFFASCVGVGEPWASMRGTPRSHSFCQYVVAADEPLIVEDARTHSELIHHPAVTELDVVAYAGMPIRSASGHVLGSFCAVDTVPRQWTDDDLATLSDLAASVSAELELRATTAALGNATADFADLLDTTTELVCAADAEGRITFANRAWRESLGYHDVVGLRAIDLVAPEHRARYVDVARRLVAGESIEGFEAVLIADDGRRVVCRGRAMAQMVADATMPNGVRCVGTRAVYRDVTAERVAESARSRLVATLEASPDFVGGVTGHGVIDYLNRGALRMVGLPDDVDLATLHIPDFHPLETTERLRDVGFPAAVRDGQWSGEGELLALDGTLIPVSIVLVSHPSLTAGEPPYVSCVMRDLRERRRADDALRGAERRFRLAMDGSLDAFMAMRAVRDAQGAIVDFEIIEANGRAASLVQMPVEDLLGQQICELFPLTRRNESLDRWTRVVETGEPEEWESLSQDPRVVAQWVQVQCVRLEDGVALSFRDITARKRAEREMNLLVDVTHALDATEGLEDAARTVLASMCDAAGWEYGESWLVDTDAAGTAVLVHGPVWHAAGDARLAMFADVSDAYTFHRGEGLPGRVWSEAAPVWIRDVAAPNASYRRVHESTSAKLTSAVGVPLLADGEVVAVLCFHVRDPQGVDESRIELLAAVASQAGSTVRRKLAEDTLARERAFLSSVLDSLSENVSVCDAEGRLTLFNRATLEYHGLPADRSLPPEEWAAHYDVLLPDGVTPFPTIDLPHVRALREQRDLTGIEFIIAPKGRPRRTMVADVHLLRGPRGECFGSVCAARDVTAQKAAEAALRESEGRLSLIYDNAADLIYLVSVTRDADDGIAALRMESVNATFVDVMGVTASDVIGRSVTEVLPSAFIDVAYAHFAQAVVTGDVVRFEHELALPTGSMVVDTALTPVFDADGRCLHVLGTSRDVTARWRAEAEKSRLSAIIEATSDYVSIANPDGQRVYINAAGRALMERNDGTSLLGAPVTGLYTEDARRQYLDVSRPAALAHGVWTGETTLIAPDGRHVPASQVLLAQRDARGELRFFATILRDLTSQKAAEDALRDSEARYRSLVDMSPDAVVVHSSGRIRYANAAARTLLGAIDDRLVGMRVLDLVHPDDRANVLERLRSVAVDGLAAEVSEERLVRIDDGKMVYAEIAAAPVRFSDADGVHDAVQVVFRDVSARRAAEAALRASEARLAALSEHDELTGLLNRRGFRRMAAQELLVERRLGRRSALLYIDLDGFKPINDTWGHAEGDEALRFVANLLRATVRESDLVARLGGDEFAVLAIDPNAGETSGDALAARLQSKLGDWNTSCRANGRPYEVRFSVGVAVCQEGDDLDSVLARADGALYSLKKKR